MVYQIARWLQERGFGYVWLELKFADNWSKIQNLLLLWTREFLLQLFSSHFFSWGVCTFLRSSTDFTNLQHWPSYSANGNTNSLTTVFELSLWIIFNSFFSRKKILEVGSSTTFLNTHSEHVINTLKKGVLSFRHKAGNGYSITKTHYRTVPVCRGSYPDSPVTHARLSRTHNRTGISSPKPQFSKRVKSNFNLKVKPKGLITTHFFFLMLFF